MVECPYASALQGPGPAGDRVARVVPDEPPCEASQVRAEPRDPDDREQVELALRRERARGHERRLAWAGYADPAQERRDPEPDVVAARGVDSVVQQGHRLHCPDGARFSSRTRARSACRAIAPGGQYVG